MAAREPASAAKGVTAPRCPLRHPVSALAEDLAVVAGGAARIGVPLAQPAADPGIADGGVATSGALLAQPVVDPPPPSLSIFGLPPIPDRHGRWSSSLPFPGATSSDPWRRLELSHGGPGGGGRMRGNAKEQGLSAPPPMPAQHGCKTTGLRMDRKEDEKS
jgi:hypothetical protein